MSKHGKAAVVDVSAQAERFSHEALRLRAVAFLCGAALMGLEMAGVRLLEPYFGSTIYVWGSIIGIFLGALSLGYWIGGIVADRFPRIEILGYIILAAALLTFLIPLISTPLCRWLASVGAFGPRTRALVGSMGLYALPSILMGMVSPFAVRLAAHNVKGLGSVAGGLYAFSTLGSLVGTFLVSFVLTELIGSKTTVFALGVMLVLVSVLCFLGSLRGRSVTAIAVAVLLMPPTWIESRGLDVDIRMSEVPGSMLLGRNDILDWPTLVQRLATADDGDLIVASVAKSLSPIVLETVRAAAKQERVEEDDIPALLAALNVSLQEADLLVGVISESSAVPYHAARLLSKPRRSWSDAETVRFNRLVLQTALPRILVAAPPTGTYERKEYGETIRKQAEVILDHTESAYHTIAVTESFDMLSDNSRARLMLFNNQVESGVKVTPDGKDLLDPIESACGYTRLLHLGVLFTEVAPKRILVIGCGGGIGPQIFAQDYAKTVERIDVVDIDPAVFRMARNYFGFPAEGASPVIRAHVEDGRLFLANSKETWDYIVLDAYTAGGRIPRHLISKEFFETVRAHLTPDGVLVANVISALEGRKSRLFQACWKTLDTVFESVCAFPRYRRGEDAENIIFVANAVTAQLTAMDLQDRFDRLQNRLIKRPGLDVIVSHARLTPPSGEGVPLLTDDFCPTDSMVYD